jgi:hypothetical protein
MFQPRPEAMAKDKPKDGAKDDESDKGASDKGTAKDSAKGGNTTAVTPSVTLRPTGDLVAPAAK